MHSCSPLTSQVRAALEELEQQIYDEEGRFIEDTAGVPGVGSVMHGWDGYLDG